MLSPKKVTRRNYGFRAMGPVFGKESQLLHTTVGELRGYLEKRLHNASVSTSDEDML